VTCDPGWAGRAADSGSSSCYCCVLTIALKSSGMPLNPFLPCPSLSCPVLSCSSCPPLICTAFLCSPICLVLTQWPRASFRNVMEAVSLLLLLLNEKEWREQGRLNRLRVEKRGAERTREIREIEGREKRSRGEKKRVVVRKTKEQKIRR
jgi:hypothetical protein